MREIFLTLMLVCLIGNLLADPPSNWGSVNAGTATNPYLVSSSNNLVWISNNRATWRQGLSSTELVHFKQTNHINMSAISYTPIQNFVGVYDGNNFEIRNLSTTSTSITARQGLFAHVENNSIIKNLGVVNCDIRVNVDPSGHTAGQTVIAGGITAELRDDASVSNCYTTGTVRAYYRSTAGTVVDYYTMAGGIVGQASNKSKIHYSWSAADVTSHTQGNLANAHGLFARAGGIIGQANNSVEIANSFSRGKIHAEAWHPWASAGGRNSYAGGIVGNASNTATVMYSYATGEVTSTARSNALAGGIAGNVASNNLLKYNLWDTTTTKRSYALNSSTPADNKGLTTSNMQTEASYTISPYNWDFDFTWAIGQDRLESCSCAHGYCLRLFGGLCPDLQVVNDGYPFFINPPTDIPPSINPLAPLFVRASITNDGFVLLEWDEPLSAPPDGYVIYRNGIRKTAATSPLDLNRNNRTWTDYDAISDNAKVFYEVGAFYSYKFETRRTTGYSASTTINTGVEIKNSITSKVSAKANYGFAKASVEASSSITTTASIQNSLSVASSYSNGVTYSNGPFIFKAGLLYTNRVASPPRSLMVVTAVPTWESFTIGWLAPEVADGYTLVNYKVYRDGEFISASEPNLISDRQFTDSVWNSGLIIGNRYSYHVTALYSNGEESAPTSLLYVIPHAGTPPSNFGQPSAGTSYNPYEIESLDNLRWLSEWSSNRQQVGWYQGFITPVFFKQTKDIDATQTKQWHGGKGFRPIGHNISPSNNRFIGVFDGGGYMISNLNINAEGHGLYPIGLFSSLNSTPDQGMPFTSVIRNVNLVGAVISGSTVVGGIVGEISDGSIVENCSVDGVIFGYASVGGIAGLVRNDSVIRSCYSKGRVTGNVVGGIVGTLNSSTIQDCHSSIKTIGGYNGGIAGLVMNASIKNCYNTGDNSDYGDEFEGGRIAGYTLKIFDPSNQHLNDISNNFWEIKVGNAQKGFGYLFGQVSNCVGRNSEQMTQKITFTDWNFTDIWAIKSEINNGYPYLLGVRYEDSDTSETDIFDIPLFTVLNANYPNPFNPETTISFSLANEGNVTIEVFNIKGQRIKQIVNGDFVRGNYQVVWSGKDDSGKSVGSGIYFYRMKAEGHNSIRKMMLIK